VARDGVGGCVGGGCGGLSLIGLLIGVGLTFWLGSIALDGGGGGHSQKRAETDAVSSILATSTTQPPTASITVRPATGLTAGATVIVSSAAFAPGLKVRVSTCLSRANLATGAGSLCDDATATIGTSDRNGHLNMAYKVPRSVTVDGLPFDCAEAAGTCVVAAVSTVDAAKLGSAPLSFTPTEERPQITLPN